MNNLCWRCTIRKTSFNTEDFKFGSKDAVSVYSSSINDQKRCNCCKDLLLIDNQSNYCIFKVPNEVKKARRRQSNKFIAVQDSESGSISTYAIYKKDNLNAENKYEPIKGYLGEVFSEVLAAAVSYNSGLKVTEAGISIELTPELRLNSDQDMCFSLKSCLRNLLLNQIPISVDMNLDIPQNQVHSLRLNQNSDLYIKFVFSSKMPANLEHSEGFMFSIVVSYVWKNVYLLGRYIKLSRRISQSKWGFSDQDKNKIIVDTSIEEILSNSLKELIHFEKFIFSSSGREDVDVRMLGKHANAVFDRDLDTYKSEYSNQNRDNCSSRQTYDKELITPTGRPFAIEIGNILNHHYLFYPNNVEFLDSKQRFKYYSKESFIQLFKDTIKEKSNSRLEISVLNFSDSNSVQKMNKEVNEKRKSYRCICYTSTPIYNNEHCKISENLKFPILLNQRTPVRVLHRRPNIDRDRKIYDLMIFPINENYFILDLLAQSGTYIKEFVNGDLGRTSPSLGDLIREFLPGKCSDEEKLNVIIVQLDVLNIH
ncbi:pseudouridylate synthase [Cryptosporidium ubiquitum]|uniref:tRNA pseudouridine(55) synthase n=1 Tax=Cryptosporidium ubiquitum TaxID=857276 RepID=A0A1J4MK80_9CRYT|nr:pseudouridylate synthase [Cryptosporidium ubiquitum]OII73253.1 pseudouridylate synthase [Cryptosporidium ubiquitum]